MIKDTNFPETSTDNLQQMFEKFRKALNLYSESILPRMSRLEQEGMIQRFKYTFGLALACLELLLHERGYANISDGSSIVTLAFQDGIIQNGPIWMQMLKSREETVDLYDDSVLLRISFQVKVTFFDALKKFQDSFPRNNLTGMP